MRNTSRYLPLYSEGALPTFEEKEIFVTRLPLMHYTFGMYALKLSKWLSLPVDASEHLEKALATMEVPERLHDATFEDVLMDLVPSWVEKGTKLPELLFAKPQQLTKEEIEKVPGWNEKGTKLLHKKLWYVVGVLSLCGQPTSLAQLMAFFDYKNRKTFRENYMNPLRSLGFIEPTIPDKQSAPDTKYVITELGRAFLMGNR